MQKRQKFISFQMFLFLAIASRRHLLPPLPLLPLRCNSQKQRSLVSFHLLPSLLSWPKPRPRQKFISFQMFLFVAFASRRRPRGLQIRIKQNATEAKVELRKRALAFAWLQLQRKRAKPGQKGKSSFRSYF